MSRIAPWLALLLTSCTAMPTKEGPDVRMMTGITEPRNRTDMKIREHPMPLLTVSMKCSQLYAEHGYIGYAALAALPTGWISQFGCAFTPWGSMVPENEPIWCDVVYVAGCAECREHEIRHCEGYDHHGNQHVEIPANTIGR